MPVCCRRRRVLAFVLGVLAISLLGLAPRPAVGDPIGDKKAEAERIASRVAELNQRIEVLAEQYNDASLQLETIKAQVAEAQAKVDQTKAEIAADRKQLQLFAVRAYVDGGSTDALPLILHSNDGTDAGQRRGYLDAAVGDRHQLVDQLAATQEDLDAEISALGAAQAQAEQVTAELESKKAEAESAVGEQRSLLAKAEGELAELVRQEQERQAAEQARRAAARQQQQSTSRASRGDSGSTGAAPSPNRGAAAAVAEAKQQLGVPYTWGGASPSTGFDCSGLTMYAWRAGGVSLPHSSSAQWSSTTHIPMSEIQPGDLIFYGSPIHHVGIYVGGGQIIHAPHEGGVVQYDSVYYWDALVGAGRVS